jgi:beta-hydroxylase
VKHYHYGLKIPKGDVGLQIEDKVIRWQEREGFVWDDTLAHAAWNRTNQPRIIIFADVLREMSGAKAWFARILYDLAQRNKSVEKIREKLRKEGIVID